MLHNLKNCDLHLIFQVTNGCFKIDFIIKTLERYMGFTINQDLKPGLPLTFADSIHFLNNSLDNFVKKVRAK